MFLFHWRFFRAIATLLNSFIERSAPSISSALYSGFEVLYPPVKFHCVSANRDNWPTHKRALATDARRVKALANAAWTQQSAIAFRRGNLSPRPEGNNQVLETAIFVWAQAVEADRLIAKYPLPPFVFGKSSGFFVQYLFLLSSAIIRCAYCARGDGLIVNPLPHAPHRNDGHGFLPAGLKSSSRAKFGTPHHGQNRTLRNCNCPVSPFVLPILPLNFSE